MDKKDKLLGKEISDDLILRLDAQGFPIVVVDTKRQIVFINSAWMVYQVGRGVPPPYGLGQRYGTPHKRVASAADNYEQATVQQGIQEVLEGLQPVFSRECTIRNALGVIRYRVTATPCTLIGGAIGAILWHEDIGSEGLILELVRNKPDPSTK